jgi:hypothetical protein
MQVPRNASDPKAALAVKTSPSKWTCSITAPKMVAVDVVVLSIYSQSKEKSPRRNHIVKTLAINPVIDQQIQDEMGMTISLSLENSQITFGENTAF